MPIHRPVSILVLLTFFSISSYYFLEDQDPLARQILFLGVFFYLVTFFVLKSMYYIRHRATFNEFYFVLGLPLIPPLLVMLGYYTDIGADLLGINILFGLEVTTVPLRFQISVGGVLSFVFFFFANYLLFRSHIRYEFIRWLPHSKSGVPAKLVAMVLTLSIPVLYFVVAVIFKDLLLLIYAFIFAFNGVLGLFI